MVPLRQDCVRCSLVIFSVRLSYHILPIFRWMDFRPISKFSLLACLTILSGTLVRWEECWNKKYFGTPRKRLKDDCAKGTKNFSWEACLSNVIYHASGKKMPCWHLAFFKIIAMWYDFVEIETKSKDKRSLLWKREKLVISFYVFVSWKSLWNWKRLRLISSAEWKLSLHSVALGLNFVVFSVVFLLIKSRF